MFGSVSVTETERAAPSESASRPTKRRWLAGSVRELFDALRTAGMPAGLRERLRES